MLARNANPKNFRRRLEAVPGVFQVNLGPRLSLDDRHITVRERIVLCRDFPHSDFEVFLDVDATTRQREAVRLALAQDHDVGRTRFVSHVDARKLFECVFRQPADARLPESFLATLRPGADTERTLSRLDRMDGVDNIRLNAPANPNPAV